MRHTTLLSALLVAPLLHAQWTNDPLVNTPVRDAVDAAATPLSSEAPNGGTYITWFESDAQTNYVLKMQLLDANGYRVWDEAGIIVSEEPQNSALFRYDLTTDHAGNAIVAFQDERGGALNVVVYKVTVNGTMAWAGPIEMYDMLADQTMSPSIGVLANDDLVIAYNGSAGAERWVGYRYITADGATPLTDAHRIGGSGVKCTRPRVIGNADGGFLIQYVNEVGNFPGVTCTMFVQRFNLAFEPQWANPAQLSTKTISFFFFPEPMSDGFNGLYLGFTTGNPDNAALNDVYMQRMNADGSTWSATGTRAMTGTNGHRFYGHLAFVDEAVGLMLSVRTTNGAQSESGIWFQRFSVGGLRMLGDGGTEAVTQSTALHQPLGLAATVDGAILVFKSGGYDEEHVHALRVGLMGSGSWVNGPTDLSTVDSNKANAWSSSLRGQHVVTTWLDDRTNNGVFAQRVRDDGTLDIGTGMETLSGSTASAQLLANATGHPILRTTLEQAGPVTIEAFDAAGALLWSGVQIRAAGTTEQVLELPRVVGIGVLRVRSAEGTWPLRWVNAD